MKIKLTIAFALMGMISLVACGQEQKKESKTVEEVKEIVYLNIGPAEFKKEMQTEATDYLLVDVRTADEFNAGAIEGAMNYDFLNGDFQAQSEKWDPSQPIYLYCAKGGRSSKAAEILKNKGFERIVELKGGYSSWE